MNKPLRFLFILILAWSSFKGVTQTTIDHLKLTQNYLDSLSQKYFFIGVQGTLNANRVILYYYDRDSLQNLKTKEDSATINRDEFIFTRISLLNLNSLLFEYNTYLREYVDFGDFELKNGKFQYVGSDTIEITKTFRHFNDTLYFHDNDRKCLDLNTGKVFVRPSSNRYYWIGGDLDSVIDNSSFSSKYKISIDRFGNLNCEFYNANSVDFVEKPYRKKYQEEFGFIDFEQHTNLNKNPASLYELGSLGIYLGNRSSKRVKEKLYFDFGGSYGYQNLRLIDNTLYNDIDIIDVKRRRIRLYTINLESGMTKTFGKSENKYFQLLFWGNYAFIKRYSLWSNEDIRYGGDKDFINRFNYGLKLRLGYRYYYAFFNYRLSPFQKNNYHLPEISPISIGIGILAWTGRSRSRT